MVAFAGFFLVAPILLESPPPTRTPTAILLPGTPSPGTLPAKTMTAVALPPLPREQTPLPLPTPVEGAQVYRFVADPTLSGYLVEGAEKPQLGDRNLHAGFFDGKKYSSVVYFDLKLLPPDSRILYADLQLTGLSRDNLSQNGEWRVNLLQPQAVRGWQALTAADLENALVATQMGTPLHPADLDLRVVNQFIFAQDQLPLVENALNEEAVLAFRLEGPAGPDKNLFTWDGGGLDLATGAHPTLNVIAIPGEFTIITNTPMAENVVTAAALALAGTAQAERIGTPTPFPRNIATATPIVAVTAAPTAVNLETRIALAQQAKAIAITTGTYTPTPVNWIVVFPTFTPVPTRTPLAIPLSTYIARLSPTPTPRFTPGPFDLLQTPVPDLLRGNILFLTDRFGDIKPMLVQPDGSGEQIITGMEAYALAFSREAYAPERRRRAIVAPDPNDVLQIWILDLATGAQTPITHFAKGVTYDPAWSPDGNAITFVSTETGGDEIYVYDLGSDQVRKITDSRGLGQPWNKHPSWSPDSRQLVFWSSRSGHPQIWVMNADGSGLRLLYASEANDTDPVWVK